MKKICLTALLIFTSQKSSWWLCRFQWNLLYGEGHHRMVATQEIYKETGDAKYINKLIENGSWTRTNSPPTDARAMPSRSFFSNLRNKLGF
ncbi:hypothetical protein J3U93_07940 [Proteus mirabilis]|nr:hypothetical protein J3U93_07940 [Proteus mirabilis]